MTNQRQVALAEIRNANRKIAATTKHVNVANLAAFTGYPAGNHACTVDCNGTVCVYDSIANAYTSVHSISEADQDRIRAAAAAGHRSI